MFTLNPNNKDFLDTLDFLLKYFIQNISEQMTATIEERKKRKRKKTRTEKAMEDEKCLSDNLRIVVGKREN